jgi:selenocysteine lyase/cysteine desulfurase
MRPLRRMAEAMGVSVTVVPAGKDGVVDARAVDAAIGRKTRLVAVVHASNVSGAIQPVRDMVLAARRRGAFSLVDAAQTAGSVPIDLADIPVDMLAAPGHKGLLGPQGTGFLYVRDGVPLVPLVEGGTGSRSENDHQPDFYPDALESGTPNSVGIAGLGTSLAWILRMGVERIREKETALLAELVEGMEKIPGLTLFGPRDPARCASVLSFRVEGMDPAEAGRRLEKRFGILVRAGLHCSPNSHRTMGSFPEGTVRVSPGPFTTRKEIALFLAAARKIRQ